jgi:hypothetical protein
VVSQLDERSRVELLHGISRAAMLVVGEISDKLACAMAAGFASAGPQQ